MNSFIPYLVAKLYRIFISINTFYSLLAIYEADTVIISFYK